LLPKKAGLPVRYIESGIGCGEPVLVEPVPSAPLYQICDLVK
jgi:hypothetical protein